MSHSIPPSEVRLSRRQMVQVGGLGMVGLGLPQLLAAGTSQSRPRSIAKPKSCIFIVQYGGAPQQDSFDLKPTAPVEIRGPYNPIATNVPGTQICEKLPKLARIADKFAILRSMTHRNSDHVGAMHMCLSGQSDGSPTENTPYFGSMLAKLSPSTRNVPSYVWLQNMHPSIGKRYVQGGTLGNLYAPMRVGQDHDNPTAEDFRVKAFDPVTGLSRQRLDDRFDLLERFDPDAVGQSNAAAASLRGFQRRALELVTRPEAQQAFDVHREPPHVRDRYGRHPLGQNLLMARRLIEGGVRLVSVTAWTGVPPGHRFKNCQTWDMHGGGLGPIFGNGPYGLGWSLPCVDDAVSALLVDLNDRGLLEDTLVVMVGEFGRTPKVNKGAGRDHWPGVFSAMLAGGGVRGGAVYGASDKHAAYVKHHPVSPENFGATIYHALDVPSRFPDDPSRRVTDGEPIASLFG
jgi:hypothetical protein